MKIINPNFAGKGSTQAQRDALTAYLTANVAKAAPTFDDVRAAVPALAGLKDGELHQVALDAGLKVEG